MQRKTILVFAILTLILGLGLLSAFFSLVKIPSQPLPTQQAGLEIGEHYWVGAMLDPDEPSAYAEVYAQPGSALSGKPIGRFRNAMPVLLLDRQNNDWCQVEGIGESGKYLEGWMVCHRLLGYQPTPMPASP
jgi:hypothetical protein